MKPVTLSVIRLKIGEEITVDKYVVAYDAQEDSYLLLLSSESKADGAQGVGFDSPTEDD